jgi:ParB-like chromosome segregation protein Spo0J
MDLFGESIDSTIDGLISAIGSLSVEERIDVINRLKVKLHEVSPFKSEPVDCVLWVPVEDVQANDYNPNKVAPPEMTLLKLSIRADGYTQPVVVFDDGDHMTVIDGFHRTRIAKENRDIRDRIHGYLPVTIANPDRTGRKDRMAATIRHNRARGVHAVVSMVDLVAELLRQGWKDEDIARELGMDADEVLRFKQTSGLASLFKDHDYSPSWK